MSSIKRLSLQTLCGLPADDILKHFNPFPDDKISNWPELKAFADDKLILLKILKLSFIR